MGAWMSNRNKRDPQFQSSSASGYSKDHPHISKKLKSSNFIAPTNSPASRLSLYPHPATPIVREVHAPCVVLNGFTAQSKIVGGIFSGKSRPKSDSGDTMWNYLCSRYKRSKEAAIDSCRLVKFEAEDDAETVNDDDGASGDSGVEEVAIVEPEREQSNKSGEIENIKAKYRELDGKAEENTGFWLSTSSGVASELMDLKTFESLSLNQRPDDSNLDASLPPYKKLLNDSAKKRDSRLRRLSSDIKLYEEKIDSLKQLQPARKQEDIRIEPFRPLTGDEEEMVTNALSNTSRKKVLVNHETSNITITGEILQCLRPGAWLNDEVINVYLELLKEREKREPQKFLKCHFFNTFFYKKLISGSSGYDYKSVRRWTTQRKLGYSLLECDKIFIPVHKEIHWCLAVINKKEGKFQYLDSLQGVDKQVMRVLARYIVDEAKDKNQEDIDVGSWKQEYVTELPNQKNGFDCGVFMIKYADFYSRGIDLCFKQEHMPYFRQRTAKEILRLRAD